MTILIIGGGGYVGSLLVEKLVKMQVNVLVLIFLFMVVQRKYLQGFMTLNIFKS